MSVSGPLLLFFRLLRQVIPKSLPRSSASLTSGRTPRADWADLLKALALVWIVFDHIAERVFGSPYFANPDAHWPGLAERVQQFLSLPEAGLAGWLVALFRDISWMGDQGVSVFLVLSGFTLAWRAYHQRQSETNWRQFYARRMLRIYPMWIVAHLLLLFPPAIFGVHLSLLDGSLFASLLGVRLLPGQLYYGFASWWFISLLLQLYLVFPLLWMAFRRWGPARCAAVCISVGLSIRGLGLFVFTDYLDAWSRGAVFVTRLPEFCVGIWMAFALARRREAQRPKALLLLGGTASLLVGLAASFTLAGMTVSLWLQGMGVVAIGFACLQQSSFIASAPGRWLRWVGRHSLSLFLVHELFVRSLIPAAPTPIRWASLGLRVCLLALGTVVAAVVLERITDWLIQLTQRALARWGGVRVAGSVATALVLVWVTLIGGELYVRKANPQEAADLGWGERPSLQSDPVFGWKLRPSQRTRLRWVTYDYQVTANALGFPGPAYPAGDGSARRVLVTGDAFTSAEGVNTDRAWPRLLESKLRRTDRGANWQVLNFAVTGYGPNQYAAVVKQFIPEFKPKLVVIGLFINDFEDATTSTDQFHKSIGFGRPDPDGMAAVLTFRQLSSWARSEATDWLYRNVLHRPEPNGYFLGQFAQLENGPDGNVAEGSAQMRLRLQEINAITQHAGAEVLIVLIPSGPQVCSPEYLRYWPRFTSLSDPRFDPDLPQRTAAAIARDLGMETVDLRPTLRAAKTCPYMPQNMHWTAAGHELVAETLSERLSGGLVASR